MHDDDRFEREVRDAYQGPIVGEELARERATARLREEPAPRRSRGAAWWTDPDAIRVRPLFAAAGLIAVLAIGASAGAWWAASSRGGSAARGRDTGAEPMAVTFVFRAPGASRVSLVGDFNGWDPAVTPLRRAALGDTWVAQVPLEHGLHAYAFVIDDTDWSVDPSAPLAAETHFGRRNSVMVVGEGAL